jgi:SAM-dependent methyltransferase
MTETGTPEVKEYWEGRTVRPANSLGNVIKRSPVARGLADLLFSVRASDEIFLARALSQRGARSVLDVACGPGKAVIPSVADYVAGVDIKGFPAGIALAKGYDECVEYEPPDYEFELGREVDAVTAINLNAHIPPESYRRILDRALRFLRPGGTLILIHEYDNDGASYRWMHRRRDKFDRFVKGMEHWYLRYEQETMDDIAAGLAGLRLVRRRPLTAGLLPSIHYFAYSAERNPGRLLQACFLAADIPISLVNYVQGRLFAGRNKCFLVGYVYEKQG